MNILHVISSMDPRSGGPCQGIRNLAPHALEQGNSIEVVCLDDPDSDYLARESVTIHALGKGRTSWSYHPALRPWLQKNLPRFDAVILNGLWQYPGYLLSRLARAGQAPPYFIFPHGMLDPWFQRAPERCWKAVRNWCYWKLFEQHVIQNAEALLFTCAEEMRLARGTFHPYRPKNQINVGYGVIPPPEQHRGMAAAFDQKCPGLAGRPYILFLGRIHPKKGVDLLIRAYAANYGGRKSEAGGRRAELGEQKSEVGSQKANSEMLKPETLKLGKQPGEVSNADFTGRGTTNNGPGTAGSRELRAESNLEGETFNIQHSTFNVEEPTTTDDGSKTEVGSQKANSEMLKPETLKAEMQDTSSGLRPPSPQCGEGVAERTTLRTPMVGHNPQLSTLNSQPALVIAGPGLETAYGKQMQRLAAELGLLTTDNGQRTTRPEVSGQWSASGPGGLRPGGVVSGQTAPAVLWPGMLTGDAKWGALYGCEAFVLTSHQENFGISVVEALACGKPVLISDQINIWREIEEDEAGLAGHDTLAGAEQLFRRWKNLSPEARAEMQSAAKGSYARRFDINHAGQYVFAIIQDLTRQSRASEGRDQRSEVGSRKSEVGGRESGK